MNRLNRRFLILAIATILRASSLFAQFQPDGSFTVSSHFHLSPNGFVNGNLLFNKSWDVAGGIIRGLPNGGLEFLSLDVANSWQTRMVMNNNGSVGIGTSNPLGKFHIEDTHLKVYTSAGVSNNWSKDGLTVNANPDAGYNVLKIHSDHSGVPDRGLVKITRGTDDILYVRNDGKVGIGTATPNGKLHVTEANLSIYTSSGTSNSWTKDGLTILANPDAGYSVLKIHSNHDDSADRALINVIRGNNDIFYVRNDGRIGVGTTTPDSKLTVDGDIHAKEVKVDLNFDGPDYVFDENYPLRSLDETKTYIDQHKHLPGIPSSDEMQQNGVNLLEMNMKLLEKVEELTLYLIEQDKKLEKQQNEIEQLKSKRN